MTNHIDNRATVINSLGEELVGPCPRGEEIDCTADIHFEDPKESYGPWIQKESGEEILHRDRPCRRYGVAVLYPMDTSVEDETEGDEKGDAPEQPEDESVLSENAVNDLSEIEGRQGGRKEESDAYDLDLAGAVRVY